MQIIYNSEQYYVVAYPVEEAYEVVDKTIGRGSFFRGDLALRFRDSIRVAAAADPSADAIDEFISDFGLELSLPMVAH